MTIKQISVFVENKPGRLSQIANILAKESIDIRALSIADTTDFGILRLIVDSPEKAINTLKKEGLTASVTSVIAVGIEDCPGGFAKAVDVFAENEIAIEYMYAFVSRSKDKAYIIIRVEDNDRAIEVLKKNNIEILTEKQMFDI